MKVAAAPHICRIRADRHRVRLVPFAKECGLTGAGLAGRPGRFPSLPLRSGRMTSRSLISFSLRVLLLALLLPLPSFATDPATLVQVVDGDTIEIVLNGQTEKVRLIGVDTPEKFESDKR